MRKKFIAIIGVGLAVWILLSGYNHFFGPEITLGEKNVTLEIVNEKTGQDRTVTATTEGETLYDLLLEEEEDLGVVFEKYDFGYMVEGLLGYRTTVEAQEYFHLTVNGEDAMTGPEGIPLAEGDVYNYTLRSYGDFSASEPTREEKTLTLEIVNDRTGDGFSRELTTQEETLYDLLLTVEGSAGVVFKETDSKAEISGLMNYVPGAEEYFHILIDGEDAKAGLKLIPLVEGGRYRLELRRFDGEKPTPADALGKAITFKVIHEEAKIDFSMAALTEKDNLYDWLIENEDDLQVVLEEYDFGAVVTGLLGEVAREEKQEYYHLTIDGEDAVTGPGQVQLTDGGVYQFELRTY